MPSHCCVPLCTNTSGSGYSVFHFPKDPSLRNDWLTRIGRPSWTPKSHNRVCEVHFEPAKVLFVGSQKELEAGSVPTLFCHCGGRPRPKPFLLLEHSYCQEVPPNRPPLGELQNRLTTPASNSIIPMKRSVEQENSRRTSRRRISTTHSTECAHSRAPLVYTPPPPNPLPSEPHPEEVLMLIEENTRLKLQVTSLRERAELVSKIITTDQLVALKLGSYCGVKWATSNLVEGLSLRFTCGATGYEQLRKRMPFPSSRTLRRSLQHINFEPGILDVVFQCLEKEVPRMRVMDQDCVLVFDEMSLQSRIDLDCSTGCYIGNVTIPHGDSSECSCKGLAFMVNGLAQRYKQVVGYHYCGSRNNTKGTAEVLVEILRRCETVGLNVVAIVCDMGNRAALKELGFRFECDNMVYGVPNPVNPSKILYVVPDFVHIFKSAKEMLLKAKDIRLPDHIVSSNNLPTNVVNMKLVEWLEENQSDLLKHAPKLKAADIQANHFKKMRVTISTNVISPQVGGSLVHLGKKYGDNEAITTGWFIKVFRRWFTLVTSRHRGTALSHHNIDAFNDAIKTIELIRDIFAGSTFGDSWKVNQTHIVMACQALLDIQKNLLSKDSLKYLCCGNLTQDAMENVFSCIRILRPKPSPLDFKFRLKQFVFGTLAVKVSNSSYTHDDRPSLIDLLTTRKINNQTSTLPQTSRSSMTFPRLEACHDIRDDEKDVLYRMSGYVLRKMRKRIKCVNCYESLLHKGEVPHHRAGLVIETDIKPGAQVRVGEPLYRLFLATEKMLVSSLPLLPKMRPPDKVALTEHIVSTVRQFPLPSCHDVHSKITGRYLSMRFGQLSKFLTKLATPVSVPFSSMSMGMRVLADNFNPARKPKKAKTKPVP